MDTKTLQRNFKQLAAYNFIFIGLYALYTIILDGGNVITRETVYRHWMCISALVVVAAFFWITERKSQSRLVLFWSLTSVVLAELAIAGLSTYWERGMASMSTVLYIIPIVTMAYWRSRSFTLGTALLCAATYLFATTKYFYDFFNEGYRVQLYGEIFFFSSIFIVAAGLLANLVHATTVQNSKNKK